MNTIKTIIWLIWVYRLLIITIHLYQRIATSKVKVLIEIIHERNKIMNEIMNMNLIQQTIETEMYDIFRDYIILPKSFLFFRYWCNTTLVNRRRELEDYSIHLQRDINDIINETIFFYQEISMMIFQYSIFFYYTWRNKDLLITNDNNQERGEHIHHLIEE